MTKYVRGKDFALRIIVLQLDSMENVVEEGKIGDIYSLVSIEKMLPSENNGKEWVQETIVNSQLRSLNQNWEAGSKVESWVKLIELYRGIWDDRKNSRSPPPSFVSPRFCLC